MSDGYTSTLLGGRTRSLNRYFADWVSMRFDMPAETRELIARLAEASSLALQLKHSCLDLAQLPALAEPALTELLGDVDAAQIAALAPNHAAISCERATHAPLVRSADGRRVWLQKYFLFERAVAHRVRALGAAPVSALNAAQQEALTTLYPAQEPAASSQRRATEMALRQRLSVISGGPGTGKTWTVAAVVALLQLADRQTQQPLKVALAAPTGKAANRMMESLRNAANSERFRDLLATDVLPDKASTLHALLAIGYDTVKPRRDAQNPLNCDVLIVDEASMIDLPMMARLLAALPDQARLLLLGDQEQLSSVEAGGVLADLCAGQDTLGVPVAVLEHNYRTRDQPELQALAGAVNQGLWPADASAGPIRSHELVSGANERAAPPWFEAALPHYEQLQRAACASGDPLELLGQLQQFQLLCALREGPAGVSGINARFLAALAPDRFANPPWFAGLPVMVLRNDRARGLFNGDVGLVLPVQQDTSGHWQLAPNRAHDVSALRACFPLAGASDREASMEAVKRAQMPPFEPAFAITVHKSQGSEYERVSLVLPDSTERLGGRQLLSRELLYTGITRARSGLDVWAGSGVAEAACAQRTHRMSGLTEQPHYE